jgi:phage terminase Nu1 subunit (DNA packaging protein)
MARGPTVPLPTLAKLINLTPRRVRQLVGEGVIPPPVERGAYELLPSVQGYIKFLQKGDQGDALSAQRTRLARNKADMAEIESARLKGEMAPIEQFEDAWGSVLNTIRILLLALPAKIAAKIMMARNAVEAQSIIRQEVNGILDQLSKIDVVVDPRPMVDPSELGDDDEESAGADEAPARADGEPVG